MGGQACVLYGGAEFSRDTDLAILADAENLTRFQKALDDLQAERIAVPPFEQRYLDMGLAVHFRCRRPDVDRMRIDVMSKMRGVDDFAMLWSRRTTVRSDDEVIELMSLPDLVRAKKTQRDKDWPMIVRLTEASYLKNGGTATPEQIDFWLRELRTPRLLIDAAGRFPQDCLRITAERTLLKLATVGQADPLAAALADEERAEREADRRYWEPLRRELERLRLAARDAKPRNA